MLDQRSFSDESGSTDCPASDSSAIGRTFAFAELAEREGIAPSYMSRVLRLTLFAPDIVEAIVDGSRGWR
ncbi:hypothetical protein [Defluviimonas sp. SAOS-178_SWC]|uniref:hypothetical protein n=1 Tax=Defluviimonas sp. SAOS-178_SWC TaxID=3121287 RepID=UPI003D80A8B9